MAEKKPRLYPIILAGGRGTRFWPLSRKRHAKQLLALDGKQTMIQQTVARLHSLAPVNRFWIHSNGDLQKEIVRQLRQLAWLLFCWNAVILTPYWEYFLPIT